MSRVNVDYPSGLFSIELVTSAIGPPVAEAGRTALVKSFEQHLDQAARTFQTPADTHRPPTPDTPRGEMDDPSRDASGPPASASSGASSRPTDSGDRENEPVAGNTPSSDADSQTPLQNAPKTDRETSVSDAEPGTDVSDADREASVSDGKPSSKKEKEEENHDEASLANATQAVEMVNVDPTGDVNDQQGKDGDARVSDEQAPDSEGKRAAAPTSQRKEASAPTGNASAGQVEGAAQAAVTAEGEESTTTPATDARKTPPVREDKGSPDESVRKPRGNTAKEDGSGDGNSDQSAAVGAELTGESAPTPDSAGDVRRRDGRQGKNHAQPDGVSDVSPADNPREPEAGQAPQNLAVSLPAKTTDEPKGDSAASATRSSASGVRQIETAGPARPQPGHGPREAPTAPARETPGTDHVDRARFVGRVARAFEAVGERNGSVRLRLHPPELGSLRLEVTVRNGTMAARLEVETHTARTALLDNLPALRDRLAEQNIKVGRFDVDLSDRSLGGSPQQPGDHPHSQHDPRESGAHFGAEPEVERAGSASLRAASPPGQGNQLDVVI